ncbi:hypothetical protein NPIL_569161 [Nephila pilipes]|uniref:Uncharacterized protein n=1 Tax=Nephila pilipes TaxID=299642 RepID=A0A8X6QRT3_NEPPI|nr:hypothetical protein NPIL_569161 [Nephila pilipes]
MNHLYCPYLMINFGNKINLTRVYGSVNATTHFMQRIENKKARSPFAVRCDAEGTNDTENRYLNLNKVPDISRIERLQISVAEITAGVSNPPSNFHCLRTALRPVQIDE